MSTRHELVSCEGAQLGEYPRREDAEREAARRRPRALHCAEVHDGRRWRRLRWFRVPAR
jgi:hypothetical protein